ncbi:MAG: DUF5671 domain-containing protein [bacterium]|nr:DUF5671 domain-containing protein [bacterium]
MDKLKVTPKDFFLWIGAMVALYVSVFSLISLLFDYINYAFPDNLNSYIDPYSGSMRYEIASLIVLFPVFLALMRFIRSDIIRDVMKKDLWIRRWVLYITVFVAGATVIGDLITLINYFLGGDLTTRFILKVIIVLLVAGGAFLHFLADIWGYWVQYPKRAFAVGWGAGLVILLSIVGGFFIMGTPGEIRNYRFDDQKINDLTNIQYQIVNYWQGKEKLPTTLADLNDPISGATIPVDPQNNTPYVYESTGSLSFKLCATFNAESQANQRTDVRTSPIPVGAVKGGVDSIGQSTWKHGVGLVCFDRTIDPQLYPPFKK